MTVYLTNTSTGMTEFIRGFTGSNQTQRALVAGAIGEVEYLLHYRGGDIVFQIGNRGVGRYRVDVFTIDGGIESATSVSETARIRT